MSTGWSQDSKEPVVEDQVDQPAGADQRGHRSRPSASQLRIAARRARRGRAAPRGRGGSPRRRRRRRTAAAARAGSVDRAPSGRRRSAGPGSRSGPRRRPRPSCAPCRPGRPTSASRASSGSASQSAKTLLDELDGAAPGSPTRSGLVARPVGRRVDAEAGAEPLPQPLAARRRSAPSRRGSGTGRRGRWTGGGCPAPGRPRRRRSSGCPGRRARRRRREQRGPDDRPDAGAVALVEGREHAVGAVHPGQQVGDRHARPAAGPRARNRSATSGRPRPGRSGRSPHDRPRVRRDRSRSPRAPRAAGCAPAATRTRGRADRARRCGSSRRARRRGRPAGSSTSRSAASLRSRVIDSLLRLAERKYVD